jgi:lysine 2,3-aminomutase
MKNLKSMQNDNDLIEESKHPSVFYSLADEKDKNIIDEIIKNYPAKITPHLNKLMKTSKAIQKQFLPSIEEQKTQGTPTPFEEGKTASETYGLEKLYRDRVLITPHFDCPAYCRFCYKKSRVMRNKPEMTYEEIDKAVAEVATMEEVRGVLITGGDPLMNCQKLFYLLDKLIQLKNITEIRIGTRTLLTKPEIFTDQLCEKLASYILPDFKDPQKSKYLAINVHFNHPDELDEETIRAAYKLTSRGIILRNQTVLLKGINDDIQTIKTLFTILIRNNIVPYYLNHCMPVEGADHFRCSVEKGQNIYRYLCTESSTGVPHYVFAIQCGKIHVGTDSKFDYIVKDNKQYINVVSLYKAAEFKKITKKHLPINHTETKDGYIQGLYWDGHD